SPHIRARKLPMYRSLALLPFATLLLASLAPTGSLAQSPSRRADARQTLEQVLADDATLRDIAFVDAKTGWVVGDRGVVLATDDGGRHWHRQEVPLDAPLLGVHFADPQRGWIVGGDATLYSHRTRGVVLRTIDGGITWQTPAADTLPRLTSVKFFDAATGLATGYSSAFYPSGLFA